MRFILTWKARLLRKTVLVTLNNGKQLKFRRMDNDGSLPELAERLSNNLITTANPILRFSDGGRKAVVIRTADIAAVEIY